MMPWEGKVKTLPFPINCKWLLNYRFQYFTFPENYNYMKNIVKNEVRKEVDSPSKLLILKLFSSEREILKRLIQGVTFKINIDIIYK